MPEKSFDMMAVRHVEMAISRLDSLLTLPCTAAAYLPKLMQSRFRPADVAEIVESDPALAIKIFIVAEEYGVNVPNERFSLRQILDRLPAHIVRDALLSIKGYPAADDNTEGSEIWVREGLTTHTLGVACCAREIAGIITPPKADFEYRHSAFQAEPFAAYSAGLLHDIGKFALQEIMPKSFSQMFEEAQSTNVSFCTVEKEHLGTDHTLLGKKLAARWHLPQVFSLAIWLHHNDTATISQNVAQAQIAQIIQSADSIVRYSGIGQSGSFDPPLPPEKIAQQLNITVEQVEQIRRKIPEMVREKTMILGLEMPNAATRYGECAHTAALHFARQQTELFLTNRRVQAASSHLDFITEFLLNISPDADAIEIASDFATRWQRFYQTGKVCLYLAPTGELKIVEAVLVESLGQSRKVILNIPGDFLSMFDTRYLMLDTRIENQESRIKDQVSWLSEQLDVEFDQRRTKMTPLFFKGKVVAVIVFELHWPTPDQDGGDKIFQENLRAITSIAAAVLYMAVARSKCDYFAEQFVQLIRSKTQDTRHKTQDQSLESEVLSLAEMTAGIAHELNNPLSVISGRVQILADAETNKRKKQTLEQIEQNVREVSAIIEEMMNFAEPPPSRPGQTDVRQMLEEAIQLASQKLNAEHVDVQIQVAEDANNVFVDSAQVASAIANIICNSLESYTDGSGPVRIDVDTITKDEARGTTDDSSNIHRPPSIVFVRIQISDTGCGMDTETLRKATHPFFSARAAGRKRGMGLAYAARMVQLNKGSLSIESQLGRGTTVTICLPGQAT